MTDQPKVVPQQSAELDAEAEADAIYRPRGQALQVLQELFDWRPGGRPTEAG